jgi:hypothetical protein
LRHTASYWRETAAFEVAGVLFIDDDGSAGIGVEPPKPRIEAVRIVDMSTSNAWAEFADIFIRTREEHSEHERAKAELKGLMPEDAHRAIGYGIRAKRSKSGSISFDLLQVEGQSNAAV